MTSVQVTSCLLVIAPILNCVANRDCSTIIVPKKKQFIRFRYANRDARHQLYEFGSFGGEVRPQKIQIQIYKKETVLKCKSA